MNSLLQAAPQGACSETSSLPALVAADMAEVERILSQSLASSRPQVARLVERLGNYRGKRLRPMLLVLTAQACGRVTHPHHVLGAVVEMIHTATLVHDDVLDAAELRRHAATINAHWGNQTSILLGDYLFTHAFHLTSTLGDARACELIGEATDRVCEGELLQICERGNLRLSEKEYFDIIDGKTAELTSCCCRLGALYAGADPHLVESIASYGRWLGVAFQIADDLLDLVGDEQRTGKSLGTDVEQQKLTLPLIRLLDRADEDLGLRLRQLLCSPGNHKREALRPFLVDSGALLYARRQAEEFAARAREELKCLPNSAAKTALETLTDQVVHRTH